MLYRKLGKTGIKVSEIGFGAWQIGGGFGKQDDAESIACIHRAMELGVNFIDTAAVYGDGHSERLIGRAVAGQARPASRSPARFPRSSGGRRSIRIRSRTLFPVDWIVKMTERSLGNLKIDCLDLQQLHSWTPAFLQSAGLAGRICRS